MSCSLDGLFPASEARVYLALGAQRLHPDITLEGDALTAAATATASAEQEGARQLACSVTLGRESRETWENVTVYSKRERGRASRASGWRPRNAKAGQSAWGLSIRMGGAHGGQTEGRERRGLSGWAGLWLDHRQVAGRGGAGP